MTPGQEPDRFVLVYIARDFLEASAVSSLLSAEGIETWVQDMTIAAYPVSLGPLSERRVLAPERQAEAARCVLRGALRDGFLREGGIVVGDAGDR